MPVIVALAVVVALAITMLVLVGNERGPQPADVAVAYELAWLRRDYSSVFDLSAKELRDGLDRAAFVAAKRAGDAKVGDHSERDLDVIVDEMVAATDAAVVVTRVSATGNDLRHRVMCERRQGKWQVVAYNLVSDDLGGARP